jgi:hypothetical protein
MKRINKACEINVPASPSLNPSSCDMSTPHRLTPDRLPDPWLLDSENLLSELARVRDLALRIPPVRNDIYMSYQNFVLMRFPLGNPNIVRARR